MCTLLHWHFAGFWSKFGGGKSFYWSLFNDFRAPKSRAPPRLFCDICDVFDQHDTDDCPLQAMDYEDGDAPSPTHYHGDRKASRPYCDICEGQCVLLIIL